MRRREPPAGDTPSKLKFRRIDLPPTGARADDGKLFISSERLLSFRSYCNRPVLNGRRLDLSAFGESDIPATIDAMGWTSVTCMDHPVYPRLVRLFYCNLESDRDRPSITSLVNGRPVHLTCESLSAMLGIPNEGVRYYRTGSWGSDDCSMLEALRLVCGNDRIMTCSRPHARTLPPWNRLLHDIVTSVFLPRGGSRDRVSRMDLFMLKKIVCQERANLPYMMIHHMIDSVFSKCLPYGMLLSKVFVECDVDIARGEFCRTLKRQEIYNSHSILRMGYLPTGASGKLEEAPGKLDEEEGDEEAATGASRKLKEAPGKLDEEEEEAPAVVAVREEAEEKQTTIDERHEEAEKEKPTSGMDAAQGDIKTDGPKSSSSEANNVYESLNKLSAQVDTLGLAIENLQCQQEQGLANLTAKLDGLMGFLNHHFCPYPPAPAPFGFND